IRCCRFEQMRGDLPGLLDDALTRQSQCPAAHDCATAAEGADALLDRQRISVSNRHVIHRTRNFSATICAKTVSCPWPWELEPVSTVISPVRSTRTVPLSNPAPPLGSTNVETPTPTSSPRDRAASRYWIIAS